jgi:hypothetical protein
MNKQQFATNEGKFLRSPMKNFPRHVAKVQLMLVTNTYERTACIISF